jgi:fructoselysine and glucoselysine-specific PTS system IIB component
MIKLTRIDDRLVHGQVAFTWVPSLSANTLLIANDAVAKDEFQKMTLNLAKPVGTKLLIKTLADSISFLNDEKNNLLKILVLVKSIRDAAILAADVKEIKSINFGGIRSKDGSRLISKAVAITDDDVPFINEMIKNNIELELRQVPTDNKQLVENLTNK